MTNGVTGSDSRADDTPVIDKRRDDAKTKAERGMARALGNGRTPDGADQSEGVIGAYPERQSETDSDDLSSLEALREAAREHTDVFVTACDMEDADQRVSSPGTREQH